MFGIGVIFSWYLLRKKINKGFESIKIVELYSINRHISCAKRSYGTVVE